MGQYLYLIIMVAISGSLFFLFKEPEKALLGLAIVVSPWQGGLWLNLIGDDLRVCSFLIIAVMIILILKQSKMIYSPGITTLLVFIILFSMVASFVSVEKSAAFRGVFFFLNNLLLFYCVLNVIRTPEDVKYILVAMALSLIFQGLLTVFKYKFMYFKVGVIDEVQSFMLWRGKGTFFHANAFGMFLIFNLPVVMRALLLSIRYKIKKYIPLWGLASFLGLTSLILSQNRGSWVGFLVGLLFTLHHDFISGKTRMKSTLSRFAIPAFFALLVLTARFGGVVIDRMFYSDGSMQMEDRQGQWEEAFEIVMKYPMGVGFRNYLYVGNELVHNLYLLVAAEIGILGFLSFIGVLILLLYEINNGIKSKNILIRNIGLGVNHSLWGFAVASIVGPDFFYDQGLSMQLFIIIPLIIRLNAIDRGVMLKVREYIRRDPSEQEKKNISRQIQNKWLKMVGG